MLVFKIVLIGIAGAILVMITKQFNWIRGSFKICAEFTKRNTDK